jgi:hypothetical protein
VPLTEEPVAEEVRGRVEVENVVIGGLDDVMGMDVLGVVVESVELSSNMPKDESKASIPDATLIAAAESYSVAATQSWSFVLPVVQGAKVMVAELLHDAPVHVAEHPVATAEQVVVQVPPFTH